MPDTNFTSVAISSTLAVTGAATLSSTLEVTGAITATGGVSGSVAGAVAATTLSASGAATLSSTLSVTGATTLSGEVSATSYVGIGAAAAIASPDDYATTYSWLYCDGTDVKCAGITLYDTTTTAYRRVYLDNGTLTIV